MEIQTKQDLFRICRLLNAKYVTVDARSSKYRRTADPEEIRIWSEKPEDEGGFFVTENGPVASFPVNMFPYFKPGDCVKVP